MGTSAQQQNGIKDNVIRFEDDTIASGRGLADDGLAKMLVRQSKSAIKFVEEHGVKLEVVSQLGGHSAARTHREANSTSSG